MSSVSGFFALLNSSVKQLFESGSRRKTLKPLVIILFLFSLEQILTTDSFYNCPVVNHRIYGSLFLFAPGACFSILALLMNKSFWELVTGCHRGNFDRSHVCRKTCEAIGECAFIGLVWFILAFSNTKFYVCFSLGPVPSQDLLQSMNKDHRETITEKYSEIKSQSTVIAWSLILSSVFVLFLTITVRRCCFSKAEGSLPTLRKYEKLEAEAAVARFNKRMKELAQKEGEEQVELQLTASKKSDGTYEAVKNTKIWLAAKYPRTTGDWTKHYRVDDVQADGTRRNEIIEPLFVRKDESGV